MKLRVTVKGVKKNVLLLRGYAEAVKPELNNVIKERMQAIFDESQNLVPVRTGDLKRSGSMVPTETGAKIVYTAPYAKRIEYDKALTHPNGQAFFVGTPFSREKRAVRAELRAAAKKPLEGK